MFSNDQVRYSDSVRQMVSVGMQQFRDAYVDIWDADVELLCWKACYDLRDRVQPEFWFMSQEEKMEHPITKHVMEDLMRGIRIHLDCLETGEDYQVMH